MLYNINNRQKCHIITKEEDMHIKVHYEWKLSFNFKTQFIEKIHKIIKIHILYELFMSFSFLI